MRYRFHPPFQWTHTEFLVLALWESLLALKVLTGPDTERAITRELLNPRPTVENYEVVVSTFSADDRDHD